MQAAQAWDRSAASSERRRCELAQAPREGETTLPEAAFSITLKGTMSGHEVLLTARGQTWEAFRANVDRLSDLLDAPTRPASPAPAAAANQERPEGWCGKHAVQMQHNEKEGRSWWSGIGKSNGLFHRLRPPTPCHPAR